MKNTSTTNRIHKASKPGQSKVRKHNESVIGEEIGSQDLLIEDGDVMEEISVYCRGEDSIS